MRRVVLVAAVAAVVFISVLSSGALASRPASGAYRGGTSQGLPVRLTVKANRRHVFVTIAYHPFCKRGVARNGVLTFSARVSRSGGFRTRFVADAPAKFGARQDRRRGPVVAHGRFGTSGAEGRFSIRYKLYRPDGAHLDDSCSAAGIWTASLNPMRRRSASLQSHGQTYIRVPSTAGS